MDRFRGLIAQTHVRTTVVIEIYKSADVLTSLRNRRKTLLPQINALIFNDAVDTFGVGL